MLLPLPLFLSFTFGVIVRILPEFAVVNIAPRIAQHTYRWLFKVGITMFRTLLLLSSRVVYSPSPRHLYGIIFGNVHVMCLCFKCCCCHLPVLPFSCPVIIRLISPWRCVSFVSAFCNILSVSFRFFVVLILMQTFYIIHFLHSNSIFSSRI